MCYNSTFWKGTNMDYDTINNIRDTILYRNDNEKKATPFTIDENIELFELACQKYGYKLWNGNAWHNNTCEQICPFGDYCSKHTVEINEERLCQGQVFSRKIDWKCLPEDTSIYRKDGSLYITKRQDAELFNSLFDFTFDIWDFGTSTETGKIIGENVIMKLYKDALK